MNSQEKTISRIRYIDIAKCLAMVLVIHNHWMLDYNNNILKILIASFHMPLFFVLSGLTLKTPENMSVLFNHVIKRIKTVLLPFYLWSFIFVDFSIKNICFIFWGSNRSISFANGIGGSWFLPCFFVADILACIAMFVSKKNKKIIAIFSILYFVLSWLLNSINISIGFPFNFDVALAGAGFICIGLLIKEYKIFEKISNNSLITKLGVFIVTLGLTIVFAYINKEAYNNSYNRLVMALGYYGNYLLFVLGGLFGTVSIIAFSMIIEKNKISYRFQKIGMNTFTILLLQQLCIDVIEKVVNKLNLSLNFIYPLIMSWICIIICYFIGLLIVNIYPNLSGNGIIPEFEKKINRLINKKKIGDNNE